MWDLIVSVPDHCLSFYLLFKQCRNKAQNPILKVKKDYYKNKSRNTLKRGI